MRLLLFFIITCVISGCATTYKPVGLTGGYSDTKLQDDVYQISFKGNAHTGSDKVKDFALLRAAELTLDNGYKYFIILEGSNTTKTGVYTTPVQANTTGNVNMYGNTGTYTGTTYYSGGQTYIYNKPIYSLMIKCLKEKPEESGIFVYDAIQIKENLSNTYKIKLD